MTTDSNKYLPLWIVYWTFDERNTQYQWVVVIKKNNLADVIDLINQTAITNSEEIYHEKIIKLSEEIHNEIIEKGYNKLTYKSEEVESIIKNLIENEKTNSLSSIYLKMLQIEFPQSLLSSFERSYCLKHSDAILILNEYLKFLAIWKEHKGIFSPSKWVDQFWHHHMSFDTKNYRNFWESVLGSEVYHQKHDSSIMSIKERQKYIRRFCKFKSVYIESFGHSPSSYIWPELTLDSSDEEEFILINIFKTLFLKIFITLSRIKKNKNPSLLELNDFKSIQKNKKSFWKSITNIFSGGLRIKIKI